MGRSEMRAMRVCVMAGLCAMAVLLPLAKADLPVHCTHSQVLGEWTFHRGSGGNEKHKLKCSHSNGKFDDRTDQYGLGPPAFDTVDSVKVHLKEPNIAVST